MMELNSPELSINAKQHILPDEPSSNAFQQANFATTQWSMVVRAAADEDSRVAKVALAELCQRYWYPLYCYVRSKVTSQEDAADIVQGFFLQLLEKSSFQMADQSRGRFRSFLLASVSNFLKNHRRGASAQKRGGDVEHLSFDFVKADQRFRLEPVDELTADKIFERSWAMELIDCCLIKLKQRYEEQGQGKLFDSLCGSLLGGDVDYAMIAETHNMNANAVKVAAHRMRQRLGDQIRREIADTVGDADDIENELQQLMSAIAG